MKIAMNIAFVALILVMINVMIGLATVVGGQYESLQAYFAMQLTWAQNVLMWVQEHIPVIG